MSYELASLPDAADFPVRELSADGGRTFVIDLGADAGDVQTDVVDGTLIVVGPGPDDHLEVTLPSHDARTFMKNGVLTIEVEE